MIIPVHINYQDVSTQQNPIRMRKNNIILHCTQSLNQIYDL